MDDTVAWMHKQQYFVYAKTMYFLIVLETGSPRSGLQRIRVLVGTVFLACRLCLFAVFSQRGDQVHGLWSLFGSCKESIRRPLIPSDRGPTLRTHTSILPSKGPIFKYIASGLGLQHENLGGGGGDTQTFGPSQRP